FDIRVTEQYDQYPALALELVDRRVAAIFAFSLTAAAAAKAATATIPIVFSGAGDPVRVGLVTSLNRPGGNVTGMTNLGVELGSKRLELMRELIPQAAEIGVLTNPQSPGTPGPSFALVGPAAGLPILTCRLPSSAKTAPPRSTFIFAASLA